jgi:hypothetical protein
MNSTISDRIRRQMEQMDGLTAENLRPLAEEYAREVDQVNARLSECSLLLRKGLRSEAIQRASMRPNVLDWAAALDFAELEDWVGILQFLGITAPTNLDRDAAKHIQEAIVEEQSLEDLLRQHRRLAIAKAPLAWRLKLLRRIRDVDAINPVWADDQQAWETVRLKEIPGELSTAIAEKSLDAIQQLADELAGTDWLVKPPSNLRDLAVNSKRKLVRDQQLVQLQSIADQLHAAFSEGNASAASVGYHAWQQVVSRMESPPPAELLAAVEPAIEWLEHQTEAQEQQKQHRVASEKLGGLLDTASDAAVLRAAHHAVLRYDLGIDPILEQRFQARIDELALKSKRKIQLIYFSVAAVVLLLGTLFGVQRYLASAAKELETAQRSLQSMVDGARLNEASSFLEQLGQNSPHLLKQPAMAALKSQVENLQQEEAQRRKSFAVQLEQLTQTKVEELKLEELVAAEGKAVTEDEKAQVAEVRFQFDRFQTERRNQQFGQVTQALEGFEQQLDAIENQTSEAIDLTALQFLINDAKALTEKYPQAGTNASELIALTTQRASQLLQSVTKQRELEGRRQGYLTALQGTRNIDTYRHQLERYVRELPDDPHAKEFSESLREQAVWQHVVDWTAWAQQLDTYLKSGLDAKAAEKVLMELTPLKQKLEGHIDDGDIDQADTYLQAVQQRPTLIDNLLLELQNSVVADLVTVVSAERIVAGDDGGSKRWFLNEKEWASNKENISRMNPTTSLGLYVVVDANGATKAQAFVGKPSVSEQPRACIRESVRKLTASKTEFVTQWESTMLAMITSVAANRELDQAVKLMLLQRVVAAASDGSPMLKEYFRQINSDFIVTEELTSQWFAPRPFSPLLPEEMTEQLNQALQRVRQEAVTSNPLKRLADRRFAWVGGTYRDSGGTVKPWLVAGKPPAGRFWTVTADAADPNVARFIPLGEVRGEEVRWEATVASQVPGRPIFFQRAL